MIALESVWYNIKTMKNTTFISAAFAASLALFSFAAERPVPSSVLMERLTKGPEIIGIVHWGLNTYTDREWGYGDEKPEWLNPSKFSADQIVKACKAGGIGGLVVVAKHHDGFCLWPSKTTSHNITASSFRGGKGDYIREMSDACRREGIKFGVYVSPWDRNNAKYGTAEYVDIFHKQIKELLSGEYGEIFEMWFDGANGGDGWYGGARERRRIGDNYYRFDDVFRFVRALQPKVAIFCGERDDSDFRWPGNERGILDASSRATIETVGTYANATYGNPNYKGQINTGSPNGQFFRACEADFPLRRGWFYHKGEEGTAKNAAYLTKLYVSSVGNGGIMNIGVAPDKDGVLVSGDVKALAGFSVMRNALFANEVTEEGKPFNVVVMRENLANGEQVDGWRVLVDGREILSGTAIGAKRIRLLEKPIAAKKCSLEITRHGGKVLPVEFKRYLAPESLVKAILEAKGDGKETDTAIWMTTVSDK